MPRYRRLHISGGTYFFTLCLAAREMDYLVRHVDLLRRCFQETMASRPFRIDAISVLPDHFHMVMTLPRNDEDFSTRIGNIKRRFSHALPKDIPEVTRTDRRQERGIWQRRFWEHAIRNKSDLDLHVGYCHWDPVRHGLAKTAHDWMYSSIHLNARANGLVGKLGPVHPRDRIKFGERSCVDRVI